MDNEQRFFALEAAAVEAAGQGIKALLLLNGGACIAVLAFVGSMATSEHLRPEFAPLMKAAIHSLIYFASGAGCAVLVNVFAYLSNQAYANSLLAGGKKPLWRWGKIWNWCGLGFAISALVLFGYSVYNLTCVTLNI